MSETRNQFEEWWKKKQANTPLPWNLKEMFWLAYADGKSAGIKSTQPQEG